MPPVEGGGMEIIMKILLYRYGSICEPDIIDGLQELGHTVTELTEEISNKNFSAGQCTQYVGQYLLNHPQDCVFTINFYPAISGVCNIFKIPYICWIVDSPILELFSKSIQNPCNRIFVFDRMQYQDIVKFNPEHIFYFPLAVNVRQKQQVISSATPKLKNQFSSDISFVGSLYTEKCPFDNLTSPSDYLSGYLEGIIESQLQVYGYYFIDEVLSDNLVKEYKAHMPNFYTQSAEHTFLTDHITVSQFYIGNKITAVERIRTMQKLSSLFSMDLYTGSDTSMIPNIHNRGFAQTLTEMPIIFHESKINLNTTSKAIRSGIPLRLFDILGCEGFVLTNYQAELPELFDIGNEVIAYSSLDEMCALASYFLAHDKERREIAHNGYEKVLNQYTYPIRLEQLLRLAFS